MRHTIYFICMTLFPILFINCRKEDPGPEKQYLFDGLPYYLNDTIFKDGTFPDKLFSGVYNIEFDSKGIAWIQDLFFILYRYDPVSKELIRWSKSRQEAPGIDDDIGFLKNLFIDSRDRIWANNLGFIYLYDGVTYKTIKLPTRIWPGEMAEDKEGNIHFHCNDEHEYMCDGESVTSIHPVFATGDYRIERIFNDRERNLWYVVDLPPINRGEPRLDVVKYSNENDYTIMPKMPDYNVSEHVIKNSLVFDSENTPYFSCSWTHISRLDKNNNWEIVYDWEEKENKSIMKHYIDYEDNIWANLSPHEYEPRSLVAFFKDGGMITESQSAKVIRDRNYISDISFPDENTVWICTSGGVFEFKK